MTSGETDAAPQDVFLEAAGLHRLGQVDDAARLYREALAAEPHHAGALYNLGLIHKSRGETQTALALWQTAIDHAPALDHAHVAMARLYWAEGRPDAALASYERALALTPADAVVLNEKASVLQDLGRFEAAVAACDQALAVQPGFALALGNRGHALSGLGRPQLATDSYRRALAIAPDSPNFLGSMFSQQRRICDWSDYATTRARIAEDVGRDQSVDLPFNFLTLSDSPAAQQRCAQAYVRARFSRPLPRLWNGERYDHDKIRLAYVSSDFRGHAVAHLISGLFEQHDQARFELHGYGLGPRADDPERRRIAAAFPHFEDVAGLTDQEIAARLRAAEIDIAIDLNGFTTHCRPGVFARRCAPIQINYLGYPGTLGAPFIDYILADRHVIPPGAEPHYSEQVIRLPHSYQVNDSRRVIAAHTRSRAEAGLPEGAFVFCCFNAPNKITPEVFAVWMRLLQRLDGSVLWLFAADDLIARNLRAEAERRGVVGSRLVFAPHAPVAEHLARHRLADLFLDTLPYNAHTTASDALWAGLPLVTCVGESFASRVAASLLHAVGLPELIAHNLDDYEALAYGLATDPDRLAGLGARLVANRLTWPLFDTDRSRRAIERAYITAWERHRSGLPPQGFDVPEGA